MSRRRYRKSPQKKDVLHGQNGQIKNHAAAPLRTRLLWGLIILVCAAVLFAHWSALNAKAVSFDDSMYLLNNKLVQNPSWNSTKRFLAEVLTPSTVEGYYQPLSMISLMTDYALGGRTDYFLPFHLTSLILHIGNAALVTVFIFLIFRNVWIAAAVGLIFGLHPVTVEPIPWIGERKTLLAAFFALLCLISYIRYTRLPNFKLYVLTFVLYILALMSKPTSTPIPVMLLLLDYWPLNRLGKKAFLEKIPFFLIAVVSSVITIISQASTAGVVMPGETQHHNGLLVICHNIVFYLYKIILPINLSSHYPFPEPFTVSNPAILAGIIGTVVLIVLLVFSLRFTKAFVAGWLFFFVAIFPTIGVIGFTDVIASDKFAYLPSVGLLLTLAFLLLKFWNSNLARHTRLAVLISAVVLVTTLETIGTRSYLAKWCDTATLISHMISKAPRSYPLQCMLGENFVRDNQIAQAEEALEKAIRLQPDSARAYKDMGMLFQQQHKTDKAIEQLDRSLASSNNTSDNYHSTHVMLGVIFFEKKDYSRALSHFTKSLEVKPEDPVALYNSAVCLSQLGFHDRSINLFNKFLAIPSEYNDLRRNLLLTQQELAHMPHNIPADYQYALAHDNIANSLAFQGRIYDAIVEYDNALKICPSYAQAHYNAGVALAGAARINEAVRRFEQTLSIDPNYAQAHSNLGVILAQKGDLGGAMTHFTKAVSIEPNDPDINSNLANAYAKGGNIEQAVKYYRRALSIDPNHARSNKKLNELMTKVKE